MNNTDRIIKLKNDRILPALDLKALLTTLSKEDEMFLFKTAREVRESVYGKDIFIRGLIEFTNYCRKNCYYCGIRAENKNVGRYRLTPDDILESAKVGHDLGFRTFVLQGGEDMYFNDEDMCKIVKMLKDNFKDSAVTLSIGERDRVFYEKLRNAGADRFLLRHETCTPSHYEILHPKNHLLTTRMQCLYNLKELGFQVGCGIMVGSPGQTIDNIIDDLLFMKEFSPQMIGIGPFIPHKDTPFKNEKHGSAVQTMHLLSIVRLMMPSVLLPSTTALETVEKDGRLKGIMAGANVVMLNLTPSEQMNKYSLYNGKVPKVYEAENALITFKKQMEDIGLKVVSARGDYAGALQ